MKPARLLSPLRFARRGSNSHRGIVTRAAGEGPRFAGIDGKCESSYEADSRRNDSRRRPNEAEALRRPWAPTLAASPLRFPRKVSSSHRGIVTRAAGEGPRFAGIDGKCESSYEADSRRNDS